MRDAPQSEIATVYITRKKIFIYLCNIMKNNKDIKKPLNSKGAAIFKKMLDDKNALHEHFNKGGKIEDFKRDKSLY